MEFRSENPISIDIPSAQALAQHKHLRCIVKLGGAAITCKNELEMIDEESLRVVCAQLREAMKPETADSPARVLGMDWSRRVGASIDSIVDEFDEDSELISNGDFVIVHGAGSFGHFQASRSGVNKGGLHLPLVKAGFVATRISIACADVSHINRVLCAGFVPILHGDAVIDLSQTDVFGVYDRPPTCPNARLLREIAVDEEGNWSIVNPTLQDVEKQVEITVASHDTTGGMETKILEAAVIAKLGINVYITKAGTEHSLKALKGEINDEWLGTVIRSSKRPSPYS